MRMYLLFQSIFCAFTNIWHPAFLWLVTFWRQREANNTEWHYWGQLQSPHVYSPQIARYNKNIPSKIPAPQKGHPTTNRRLSFSSTAVKNIESDSAESSEPPGSATSWQHTQFILNFDFPSLQCDQPLNALWVFPTNNHVMLSGNFIRLGCALCLTLLPLRSEQD